MLFLVHYKPRRAGRSKNSRSPFKLILSIFAPFLAPMPNFIQIGQKTQKLEIFTFAFAFGRFWLVGLLGQKLFVGILNSSIVVSAPLSARIPNFIEIGQKHRS